MPSLSHSLVIGVLRIQGRKRRWANGKRMVEAAREHSARTSAVTTSTIGDGAMRILYLHGGGFVHDFAPQHFSLMRKLAARCRATVIAVHYPLAPEHTWRDSFADIAALARDCDAIAGDSAGGGIALAVAQALAAQSIHPRLVLIAPFVDLTLSDPRTPAYDSRDPWLATDGALVCARAWAGEDDPARPELSPLFGRLDNLGPILVLSGTRDLLHPQSLALAAASDGVQLVIEPGCVHDYPLLPIPEARRAMDQMVVFLND